MSSIYQDVRQALRGFRRTPAFTAVAIASLALGIGANTGIFSFVNAILLTRLPVPEPQSLVTFGDARRGSGVVWNIGTIDDLAQRASAFDGVLGWFARPFNFSTGQAAHWVAGELVTGQYYRTLQVKPALGELLTDDGVRDAAANPVCVLSYDFWQSEFGGDPHVVARAVFLQGRAYRVLGVTGRGFYGADMQRHFDVAAPVTRIGDFMPSFGPASLDWRNLSWLAPMARLRPGITRVQAEHLTEPLLQPDSSKAGRAPAPPFKLRLNDGSQGLNTMGASFGRPILVLMAIVALVLLAACANLANLLLARAQARAKELAVRVSLGASRAWLMRQFLIESLLLAAGGGLAGIGMSLWITRTLLSFLNAGRSAVYALHITADGRVLTFSLLLSSLTALLFGLAPAIHATRPSLLPGLHGSAAAGAPRSAFFRRSLIVIQIALSLAIVFAAGLLTRTLRALQTVDLGFQPDRVIALNVDPAAAGYSASESSDLLDKLLRRARSVPGVKAATLALSPPNGSMVLTTSVDVPGYTPKAGRDNLAYVNFISSGYFETLGQSLLRGRDFDEHDGRNAARVAIVNRKFVQHYFEGRDPLGRKIREGNSESEIVGVVSDSRDFGIRKGPLETVYLPETQSQTSGLTLLVRTIDAPRRAIPTLLALVRAVASRLAVFSVHTLDVDVDAGLSTERILAYLSSLFAALAALLAAIGFYGVLAYSVTRRTREIGVRFAVGAQRRNVVALFARESLSLVLLGFVLGALAALAVARSLQSLLFGIAAADPLTLFLSLLVLALVAVAATVFPLWRAVRVSPSIALRHE